MRSYFLLSCTLALVPLSMSARDASPTYLEMLQSSSAVSDGRVLIKQPATGMVPLRADKVSPLDAYLAGYGPMTSDVLEAIDGRPILHPFDARILSRAEGEDLDLVYPRVIIKNWDNENAKLTLRNCVFYSFDGFVSYVDVYGFDQECTGWWPLLAGEADVVAIFTVNGVNPKGPMGEALLFGHIDLSQENDIIVLDANDLKYSIQLNAYLPDGSRFPGRDSGVPGPIARRDTAMWVDGWFDISTSISNAYGTILYNEMPCPITVLDMVTYMTPEGEIYAASMQKTEKFEGDYVYDLPVSLYTTYSANFSLSEEDKAGELGGFSGGAWSFAPLYTRGITSQQWDETPRPESVSMNCCFMENDIEAGSFSGACLGVITKADETTWMIKEKRGGIQVMTPDGYKNMYTNALNQNCFLFPEITMIDIPEKYYTKALYLNGVVNIWCDWENNKVWDMGAALEVRGPENEFITGFNPWDCVTNFTYNGEKIEPVEALDLKVKDGDAFTVTFDYDNILVNESIAAGSTVTIGFSINQDDAVDTQTPAINYYQVRNSNNEVVNLIDPAEGGKLYVATQDNGDYSLRVALCKVGANEEIELNVGVPESTQLGDLYEFDLAGMALEADQWYNLHIVVTDAAGNFIDETIGYAIQGKQSSGLETVEAFDGNAVYYDLSGRHVIEPVAGIYIKEVRKADGTITRSKVAVL